MTDFAVPSRQQAESEATHAATVPGSRSEAAPSRTRRAAARLRPSAVPARPAADQPALRLGPEGDRYEREAEFHAGAAASGPAGRSVSRADGAEGTPVDAAVTRMILGARGRGHPLPETVRDRYEPTLGTDLAAVRLHTGSLADRLNAGFQSSAFTVGHDIFFRDGAYDPAHGVGGDVLSHELHHVAQQEGAGDDAGPLIQRMPTKQSKLAPKKSTGKAASKKRRSSGKVDKDEDYSDEDYEVKADEEEGSREKAPRAKKKPSGQPFTVPFISYDKMKDYLLKNFKAQKRPWTDEYPNPVVSGSIVWNVNHLGTPVPRAKSQGSVANPATLKKNIATAKAALDKIRAVLAPIAGEPDEGPEEDTTDESGGSGKATPKQIKTDVDALLGEGVPEVIELGLITKAAQQNGDELSLEDRSINLGNLRHLNQVWKRLNRIRGRLPAGQTKKRKTILDSLDATEVAEITKNIQTILSLAPLTEIKEAVDTLKRTWLIGMINNFFKNPNVHVILLNEVNLGMDSLAHALKQINPDLAVAKGPVMLAKGKQVAKNAREGKGDIETMVDNQKIRVTGKQHEYYPAIYRKKDVRHAGVFYVNTDGEFAVQQNKKNAAIPWDKKAGEKDKTGQSFRGIVVHRFVQNKQEFWNAVVHTTPAGSNLDRQDIWPQLEKPLAELNRLARELNIPLAVGGDYYISAEAMVRKPVPKVDKKKAAEELAETRRLQFWNTTDNAFHVAGQNEIAPELLRELLQGNDQLLRGAMKQASPREKEQLKISMQENKDLRIWLQKWEEEHFKNTELMDTEGEEQAEEDERKVEHRLKPIDDSPEYLSLREVYQQLVQQWLDYQPQKQSMFTAQSKFKKIAKNVGIDAKWNQTFAGGKIKLDQFHRNANSTTLAQVLDEEKYRYRIVGGVGPTNSKEKGGGEDKAQVADFYIVNDYFQTAMGGIPDPETGDVVLIDKENWPRTNVFWGGSDHGPQAIFVSTRPWDKRVAKSIRMTPGADDFAGTTNQESWDKLEERLATFITIPTGVKFIIDQLKQLLDQPLRGPDQKVADTVSRWVNLLLKEIPLHLGAHATPEQEHDYDVLWNDIADWSQTHGLDYSEDKMEDDQSDQERDEEEGEDEGEREDEEEKDGDEDYYPEEEEDEVTPLKKRKKEPIKDYSGMEIVTRYR